MTSAPDLPDATGVATRLADLHRRIDAVERRWTHPVDVTAVTKAFPPEVIDVAVAAGCGAIGENYAQELLTKVPRLMAQPTASRPRVDFVGRLQSNKIRLLVDVVDRWCTIDRPSVVRELGRRAPGAHVLVQVNATDEPQKGGCPPDGVADLVARCRDAGLIVDGLMCIGPTGVSPTAARPAFERTRRLVDDLGLEVCSLGMTHDVEVAVAAGSTNVRIGTALFGPRPVG